VEQTKNASVFTEAFFFPMLELLALPSSRVQGKPINQERGAMLILNPIFL